MSNKTMSYIQNKKIAKSLLVFSMIFFIASFSYGDTRNKVNQKGTYSLTVKVDKLRNSKGVVQFSLYNKDDTIPDKKYSQYFRQLTAKIRNGVAVVTFAKLPAGRYAVNILHDENQNKKIDKGFMLPVEGVGFSNFQSISLRNRPNFSKASFDLQANMLKTVKVIYF